MVSKFERPRAPVPTPRLVAAALLLAAVFGCASYLLYLPMLQIYWGVYARLKPFLSEEDLLAAGRALPGAHLAAREQCLDAALVLLALFFCCHCL